MEQFNGIDSKEIWSRILKKVKRSESGCLEWTGTRTTGWGGYGYIRINKKMFLAHRVSYSIHTGEIPNKILVCHRCDNPICIEPSHLFLGTDQENIDDMMSKGRQKSTARTSNGRAKLSEEDVIEIRRLYATGNFTHRQIAKEFGMSKSQISNVIRKDQWPDL
jgi:predicted XRE-type DNA-binding protein